MDQRRGSAPRRGVGGPRAADAWRFLVVLALGNFLNFYDRTIPAIVVEPIKAEFGLSDTEVGVVSGAFTLVFVVAGVVLGRVADLGSRRRLMAWGLLAWSAFTAASGAAWSFAALLGFRLGVGVGESCYAPAANSVIADLFPSARRSRAVAVFQLGMPMGLLVAFFTTGAIVEATGSWRGPFLVAAFPGALLALALLRMEEPLRGATDGDRVSSRPPARPIRAVLRIPTMRWLILSSTGLQVAGYATTTFLVPLLQRYFGLSLVQAAMNAGVVLGLTGLVGLLVGGIVAERAARHSPRARLLVGATSLAVSVPLIFSALLLPPTASVLFVVVFSAGWFLQFSFAVCAYPAVFDVVGPRLRGTGTALLVVFSGGALGPVLTGALSDWFASTATVLPGAPSPEAVGLHHALGVIVPVALAVAAVGLLGAAGTAGRDHARMSRGGSVPAATPAGPAGRAGMVGNSAAAHTSAPRSAARPILLLRRGGPKPPLGS